MKKYLKSFWFCFFGFILLFTIYDYIKHLMYDDSTFRDHALDWFLFSSISILTLSGIIYASYLIIQKLIKPRNFAFDGVGVALAFVVHIKITGPLYNQLFWPHDTLYFFLDGCHF